MTLKKLCLLLLLGLGLLPRPALAELRVVATLPVFSSLAEEVGGERVSVSALSRPDQDPHFLDAKPSFVVELNRADMLIHGGLDLEVGWLPAIVTQARNAKILANAPGNINAAQGLTILEVPQTALDRSMGDVHPLGNPHTWLDPRNVRKIAAHLYQRFAQQDPEGRAYYETRLKNFLARLDTKIAEWERRTQRLKGKRVLTYHKSFSYFAAWTGLEVVDTIEAKPGIPPSAKHIDDLLKKIPQEQVKAICVETFYPKKVPQSLAEKTGIPLLVLPIEPGEFDTGDYFELIDYAVGQIEKALS